MNCLVSGALILACQCGKVLGHLMHLVALLVAIASCVSSQWVTDSNGGKLGLCQVCGTSSPSSAQVQCFGIDSSCHFNAANITVGGATFVSSLPNCSSL